MRSFIIFMGRNAIHIWNTTLQSTRNWAIEIRRTRVKHKKKLIGDMRNFFLLNNNDINLFEHNSST